MSEIVQGAIGKFPDLAEFLKDVASALGEGSRAFFEPGRSIAIARAPGRLDVMGGFADYSGALVLQLPLAEAAFAAVQTRSEPTVEILSLRQDGRRSRFRFDLSALPENRSEVSYERAREFFREREQDRWAAYVGGSYFVLRRELGARYVGGARILIGSAVPEGSGVSSSAALEVASMRAIAAAHQVPLTPEQLALFSQKLENRVVGAPCGAMDQMTAVFGQTGRLLALLCQPARLEGALPIPDGLRFWGIDSGVRHQVSGEDYGRVRAAAFMGRRILAEQAAIEQNGRESGKEGNAKAPLGGYLANISPSEFLSGLSDSLPEEISGKAFLQRYGETGDPMTQVDADQIYAVRAAAAHPVNEHFRVRLFRSLFRGELNEDRLRLLGELMLQSHAGYSACGLGSEQTDLLVDLVRELGPERGLYGAKVTGGGSGGAVAVLSAGDAQAAVFEIAARYSEKTGKPARIFADSSSGAVDFGIERTILSD
ncbi:MAG TPA: galactokinase family protein [Acidobacteriota bacterium]|nr:galactokinase family protein [Acidobacteriota bacterium]